jgi:uncharacterized protein (DUF2336 family)
MTERGVASAKLTLTSAEVQRLLEDKTSDSRADITNKIAASYSGEALNEPEKQIAEQIFRLLVRDTEIKVRASLAENLKSSTQIPRDIVMSMAQDVAEVSLPILQYSEVLNDEDLLDIIRTSAENNKYVAIAKRNKVSETISDSLVQKGNEEVVGSLLNNIGAVLTESVFANIIERHKENPNLLEAMTSHPQLPVGVVEKLVTLVSSNIAETLKQKYHLPSEQIHKEVEKTRESETLGLVRAARSHTDVDKLISQLQTSDRLNPSMILSALCQGNFDFFESSLAKLSNIPVENARTLIADRGDLGFRAIYNKSGLPDTLFPPVKLLLKIVRELDTEGENNSSARYSNRIVERILQYSEESPVENLSYIIALVRRVAQ